MSSRLAPALAIPLLCSLSLQGCGSDPNTQESTTDPSSTGTSTSTGTGSETTSGDGDGDGETTPTTTGPDDDNCGCADDEVCVARADDFCGEGFGYSITCEPTDNCDGPCSCDDICGGFCAPACDYGDVSVDFWCSIWTNSECDIISQDCPDGEKCVPYASTGQDYDARKCVPILGDQAAGEVCESTGMIEATDDCGADSFCHVPEVGETFCQPFCLVDFACEDSERSCLISNEGSVVMCMPNCDPLADMPCGEGLCGANPQPNNGGAPFLCLPFASSGLAQGQACEFVDDCGEGLVCGAAELLDGCGSQSCCTALCELDDPQACAGLEPMMCLSYFEGMAPAGLEQLGYCGLPQP